MAYALKTSQLILIRIVALKRAFIQTKINRHLYSHVHMWSKQQTRMYFILC